MAAQPIGHLEKVRALAVSGRVLAVGGVRVGTASQLHFYDFVGEKLERSVDVPAHVLALAGDDAGFVAACADGVLRFYAGYALEREVRAHQGAATAVAMHGDVVASAGADGALRTFARKTGAKKKEWALSSRPLRAVAIDPAGEAFAGAGDDGVVRVVWTDGDRKRDMPGHDGPVLCLAFTPADGRLASGGDDGTVRLWYLVGDVEADVRGKDDSGHAGGTTALLFPPAKDPTELGERFYSAGVDGKLRLWRASERRKPRTFETRGNEPIWALAFAPIQRAGTTGRTHAGGDARTVFAYPFDAQGQPLDQRIDLAHGFDVLAQDLAAPAKAKRETAVKTLAALGEPEALELAIRALAQDKEPEIRALAASELAGKGRRDARKALRERLDDGHAQVRAAALEALRSLEKDAPLSPLRAALDSKYADVRAAALRALPPLFKTSPLVGSLIAGHLSDADASVRRVALAELVSLQPARSVEPLRTAFERGTPDVRAEVLVRGAVDKLLADGAFTPIVGKALDDADTDVRRVAFVASALARPALAAWLESKDEAFVRALGDVVRRVAELGGVAAEPTPADLEAARAKLPRGSAGAALGEEDREPLLAALACRTADTSLRGARGLALLGDMRALGALLTISREPDAALRRDSAHALVALEDPRARRRLAWMMSDPDPQVRDAALQCYGKLEPDALAVAQIALQASQEDVRVRGLDVLVKQGKGQERAETILGDSLEDEAPKVRAEAFRTLWSWHDKEPLGPLDRALEARFPDLRVRAVQELTALAKQKDGALSGPARERIAKAIADRDLGVAKAAYDATLELAGKDHAETHLAAMASVHADLRARGAKDSTKAPEAKVRSTLSKLLEDTEAQVRTAAIEALDALLPGEAGPLHVGLQSSHLDLRVRAAELLAARRDDQLVNPMQALLADKELLQRMPPAVIVPLRQRAATALASLGSPKLLRYFATDLIKDDDPIVREQAARGVSNASRRGEEGFLLDLLAHEAIAVRSWAAEGLARLGDARALPVLTGTLRHEHPPIRVGAVLSFAALGPEGYGGMLQGLEDPSRDVQRIVLSVILARDLRAFRKGEAPELLTSALSSQRPEVRFAAARALELRIDTEQYVAHLVQMLAPEPPERAEDLAKWPDEATRARLMVGLAEAIAGDRPEQRYAAAQALRLHDRPLEFFREVQRAVRPRAASSPWVPETTPQAPAPAEGARKGPLALLRRLFAHGPEADEKAPEPTEPKVGADEQKRLRLLAFGAYVGLLRQAGADDESHRVRRDAIERIVELTTAGHLSVPSSTPALARALDDPNHLVRRAAFAALRKVYTADPETPLALALASSAADVVRAALDELATRGDTARIAKALDSDVAEARKYAFELLEKLSPKGSLEPLLAALGSEHTDVRIGVLERLATSQDPRVSAALGKALESDHDDLRLRAAELLAGRRDDRAVDVLAAALRSDDAAVVGRATEALARIGSPAAVAALAARIEDVTEGARVSLVEALGRTRGVEAIDALAARMSDEDAQVRSAAVAASLALIGPRTDAKRERGAPKPKARDMALAKRFFEAATKSRFPDVRVVVGGADDLDDPSADALVTSLFGDRSVDVRVAAITAYAKRVEKKGAAPGPLEEVVRAGARETMLAAAEGLAHKGLGAAFRPLLLFVRAGEDGERERALLGLGILGDKRALEELELVAAGGTEEAPAEPPMQAAALEALGRLHGKLDDADAKERVRDRIEANVGGKIPGMPVAAVKALRWLGGERARARIEAIVTTSSSSSDERRVGAEALGELGDVAAEGALAKALDDWDDDVRAAAREALEKLFPKERTRIELLAVESSHEDISGPAAAYLATEGDAAALLVKLAKIDDDSLRERLRYGLARREHVPAADLEKLLETGTAAARADAAWLCGVRAAATGDGDRTKLGRALAAAARKAEEARALAAKHGKDDARDAEEKAEVQALWAARRMAPADARAEARKLLAGTGTPVAVRVEAARALAGGGAEDVAALKKALTDGELRVRAEAASSLGTTSATLHAVATAPLDPVLLERVATGRALPEDAFAKSADRRVSVALAIRTGDLTSLVEVATGGEGADQLDAIGALGLSTAPVALEALAELCSEDSEAEDDVKQAAYRALRRAQRRQARTPKEASP